MRVGVRVRAASDSFLVLSDVNYPGWGARVDGREARLFQTDYSLRGVGVPAGEHTVEFVYAPRSLRLGAWLSAASLVAVAVTGLWLARRARHEPESGLVMR